jgi:hypothetical protein
MPSGGPAYRPLAGYVVQNLVANNTLSNFTCSDAAVCITAWSANASCGLAVFQTFPQTCQLLSVANTTGQILMAATNGTVYQKPQNS